MNLLTSFYLTYMNLLTSFYLIMTDPNTNILFLFVKSGRGEMDDHFSPQPGPIDDSVLYLQPEHRSNQAYDGDERVLHVRRCEFVGREGESIPQWLLVLLHQTGFYGFNRVGFMKIDWHLITALVERWRQETHTFHLPVGECTITLQDVQVLLGLSVEGKAVTINTTHTDLKQLCVELLGRAPADSDWKGSKLKMSWIKENFFPIPDHIADDVVREQYARAYLLLVIGGCLFPDNSGSYLYASFLLLLRELNEVSEYSWGSATLAWLYRQLCRASRSGATDIWGPVILVQLWAYERITFTRPVIRVASSNPDQQLPLGHK
jgi:hypothetical protein